MSSSASDDPTLARPVRCTHTVLPLPVRSIAVTVAGDHRGLVALLLDRDPVVARSDLRRTLALEDAHLLDDPVPFARFLDELAAYLTDGRHPWSAPVRIVGGTPFQRAVWERIDAIPAGATRTYGEIAAAIGAPGAARAVGGACGKNPIPLRIPCHRVVSGSGLGGFTGEMATKRALLAHEGVVVPLEEPGLPLSDGRSA